MVPSHGVRPVQIHSLDAEIFQWIAETLMGLCKINLGFMNTLVWTKVMDRLSTDRQVKSICVNVLCWDHHKSKGFCFENESIKTGALCCFQCPQVRSQVYYYKLPLGVARVTWPRPNRRLVKGYAHRKKQPTAFEEKPKLLNPNKILCFNCKNNQK